MAGPQEGTQTMFNNSDFTQTLYAAEITYSEFADFVGISHKFAWDINLCKQPVTKDLWAAAHAMIKQKAA